MSVYIGVDGCKAGWFAVILRDGDEGEYKLYPTIGKLWAEYRPESPAIVLIDIPIGLPEEGARQADLEAQRILGERRSSIFSVPTRAALYASAFGQGREINRRITGRMFSQQLWNIAPQIREVDSLLRHDPEARATFKETHPEVLFWGLAGHPMHSPKKTPAGFKERIKLVQTFYPGAAQFVDAAMKAFKRREVQRDDIVDALVEAVAGKIGTFATLPSTPEFDARGLPMQIVYALRPGLIRVHHVQITVPTEREAHARAFYLDLLGLREIPKPEALQSRGGFWAEVGGVEIHISLEDGIERQQTKAHVAYAVGDLEYWREKLTEQGIEIGESVPLPGYNRFEFRDPFGNRVEFIQPLTGGKI
jgi:predicted RNase H-like nuclease/catechol 2,3-dioxygenase-like lactoylglutathione lyase family enzyme